VKPEWNLPVPMSTTIPTLDISHKHSGHEVVMSGGANACPICQAFTIITLQSQITQSNILLVKCREALFLARCNFRRTHSTNLDQLATMPTPYDDAMAQIDHALSQIQEALTPSPPAQTPANPATQTARTAPQSSPLPNTTRADAPSKSQPPGSAAQS